MSTLKTKLDIGNIDDEQIVWGTTLTIQYSKDGGKTWTDSGGDADGIATIGSNLLKKLGLSSNDDLIYGENYRFGMYNDYTFICGWNIYQSLGKEYVAVEWEIAFPITGEHDGQSVFFTNLEDALTSESEYITINKDVTVDSDVVVPEGVWIFIADGATLEIKEGNTFENNGKVYGDVRVNGVVKTYSSIVINPSKNGSVSVNSIVAASGDTVIIENKADAGYILKSILVYDSFNDKIIEVKDGKFVMPTGPVEITA